MSFVPWHTDQQGGGSAGEVKGSKAMCLDQHLNFPHQLYSAGGRTDSLEANFLCSNFHSNNLVGRHLKQLWI